MNEPYRVPASLALVVSEHRGPYEACPVCGVKQYKVWRMGQDNQGFWETRSVVDDVRGCRGRSWLLRLLGGCARRDLHLHQGCGACGARWMCLPKVEDVR